MKSKKKILIGSLIVLILAVALIAVPQIVTSTAQAEEETTPQESTYTYKNDYGLDKVLHLNVFLWFLISLLSKVPSMLMLSLIAFLLGIVTSSTIISMIIPLMISKYGGKNYKKNVKVMKA